MEMRKWSKHPHTFIFIVVSFDHMCLYQSLRPAEYIQNLQCLINSLRDALTVCKEKYDLKNWKTGRKQMYRLFLYIQNIRKKQHIIII